MYFDAIITLFEFYMAIKYLGTIFYKKEKYIADPRRYLLILGILAFLFVDIILISIYVFKFPFVVQLLISFSFILMISNMYEARLGNRLFYASIFILIGVSSEIFFLMLFKDSIVKLNLGQFTPKAEYYLGAICSKIICFFFTRLISLVNRKEKTSIPFSHWFIFVMVPIISLTELHLIIEYSFELNMTMNYIPLVFVVGVILINILVYIMYDILIVQFEKSIEHEREAAIMENDRNSYQFLIEHGQNLAAELHDRQKHIDTMSGLLNHGEIEECMEYLTELGSQIQNEIQTRNLIPGNVSADILLNAKIKEAEELGIKVEIDIDLMFYIPLGKTDLCVVIGNAMDNAIRACLEYNGERRIIIRINKLENKITLLFGNTSNPVKIESNGLCKTTKSDKRNHGYGLKKVRKIILDAEGSFFIDYNENIFSMIITIFL